MSSIICSSILCVRKCSSKCFRNLLDCWCPTVLPLQQIPRCLKSPTRTTVCEHEAYYSCLKASSTTFFRSSSLQQTPTKTLPILVCLLIRTQTLSWFICPKAEFHAFPLLSHKKGKSPSSPFWLIIPEDSVCIHCSTPVM